MALPGTSEVEAWGHPNFRVAGRTFAVFEIYKGRPCIAISADPEEQSFLVERFGFFKTPYVGNRGWVSAWVDQPAPFRLMGDLIGQAHRRSAAGPRHLAIHPNNRFIYVLNELDSTVSFFAYDAESSAMQIQQTATVRPDGFAAHNSGAQILLHPAGRFLYTSNRGHNSIAIFAVDQASGLLTLIGHESTRGDGPRNVNSAPGKVSFPVAA